MPKTLVVVLVGGSPRDFAYALLRISRLLLGRIAYSRRDEFWENCRGEFQVIYGDHFDEIDAAITALYNANDMMPMQLGDPGPEEHRDEHSE